MKYIFIILTLLLPSSCTLLPPVKPGVGTTYVLCATPKYVPEKKSHASTILVMSPDANPTYNTTQMAYTTKPFQIAYFSENSWAETPPQMFHPLIVQALQNTHYFNAVIIPPFAGRYDYALITQIIALQQDFTCRPALLKLKMRAQLSKTASHEVIATQDFVVHIPFTQRTPYAGVIAANQATEQVLKQIAAFSVQHT